MKTILMKMMLVLTATVASLLYFPIPAVATLHQPPALENRMPSPVVPAPDLPDFSDDEFAKADQEDLGDRKGADVGGLIVFVLVVVLLVLLILWVVREGRVP